VKLVFCFESVGSPCLVILESLRVLLEFAKWWWMLLLKDQPMWKKVVIGKYGDSAYGSVVIGEESKPWYSSVWWRDICSIGTNLNVNWFSQLVVKKIGNGLLTSFWSDK
jgi:hypothetical protein